MIDSIGTACQSLIAVEWDAKIEKNIMLTKKCVKPV